MFTFPVETEMEMEKLMDTLSAKTDEILEYGQSTFYCSNMTHTDIKSQEY